MYTMVMLKLLYNLPHLNLWGMTLRAQIHFFFVRGILFLEFYNVNLNLNLNFPRGGPPSPYGSAHAGLFFIYFFRGEGLFFPLSVCELLFKYPVHHISWMLLVSVKQIFFSFPMFIDIHVHVDTWNISACEECKTSVVCRL